MTDAVTAVPVDTAAPARPRLESGLSPPAMIAFIAFLTAALLYVLYNVYTDIRTAGGAPTTSLPYVLLFVALLTALAFEFVNGFHDTANAVATVIYTHSLPAPAAVAWSGSFNFLGVLLSSGTVAFAIVSLLPVELIIQVGHAAGFAMIFSLLIAAVIWNVGTWYFGLPASSSHTLIGSIIGVGVANALMHGLSGTSGVDWEQATSVGEALLFSPVIGFALSATLLLIMKLLVRQPALYAEPRTTAPPAWWIRALLIFTCASVSFAHGSNDGQKGMGLIMLILIGIVPTAFALNRALPDSQVAEFSAASAAASQVIRQHAAGHAAVVGNPRPVITEYVAHRRLYDVTFPALAALVREIDGQVTQYGSLRKIPAEAVGNTRNDIYLVSEALRLLVRDKSADLTPSEIAIFSRYKQTVDNATKFIPGWVKLAVAVALGLGTMVGWKRIVITVGERIGKTHLTYGQGAAAELVAAGTIAGADIWGLPVSTTHVLSSGVAGTMAANGSGLQWSTVRNIAMAWVLTLPAAMLLSGVVCKTVLNRAQTMWPGRSSLSWPGLSPATSIPLAQNLDFRGRRDKPGDDGSEMTSGARRSRLVLPSSIGCCERCLRSGRMRPSSCTKSGRPVWRQNR